MKTIENDLTRGSVFKKLWGFTLPLIGANLLQILYGMVDLYIVGRFAATADVSAVSVSTTVLSAFLMFLIGLAVGATVVVGQRFGAGEKAALSSVAATGFSLAWIVGAALMVLDNIEHRLITDNTIIDGRDVNVRFPNADFKFYLTANSNTRISRMNSTSEEVSLRDKYDLEGNIRKSDDIIEIDTDNKTLGEIEKNIIDIIKNN